MSMDGLALVAGFALLAFGLRKAPVVTTLAVCALGAAGHFGVLTVPAPIARPISAARADVAAWQARQADKLVCAEAESRQLGDGASDPPPACR